ncbi:MAG: TolC family protein [Flavobacteriaceae bacterium]
MKKIIVLCFILLPLIFVGQNEKLTLERAIKLAQKNSTDYKSALNRNQANYWRYKNYEAGFLPQVRIDATLPSYSKSTRRITNDNGQDIFVNQNQSRMDLNLSVSQNVPFTGGSLSLNSQVERIDIFGTNPTSGYSIVPFSINYFQNSLFYNPYKWDKKIEPLVFEESKRAFVESMEQISLATSRQFFGLLKVQKQLKISKQNFSNQADLFKIAEARFKMGKIAENDLLQMELSLLNSKNNVISNEISLKRSTQNLARYLGLQSDDVELIVPQDIDIFEIDVDKALKEAQENRKSVIEYRRRRLQAEKELARVKGDGKLEMNIRANFGMSQQGPVFNELFSDLNRQQNVTLSLGIPIFDWGVSKSKRKMAKANLDLVNTNLDEEQQAFEQEIYLHTLNWQNQKAFLETSKKAQEIALKRYDITQKRYVLGKITITDLNLAQQEKDNAIVRYLNSVERFWVDYYTLRRLTLYDFVTNKKIEAAEILFE